MGISAPLLGGFWRTRLPGDGGQPAAHTASHRVPSQMGPFLQAAPCNRQWDGFAGSVQDVKKSCTEDRDPASLQEPYRP